MGSNNGTLRTHCRNAGARGRLEALVSRGKILLHTAEDELTSAMDEVARCEKYFGGATAELSDGQWLFSTVSEILTAFRVAWLEVHRDEKFSRWLPNTPAASQDTSRSGKRVSVSPRRLQGRPSVSPRRLEFERSCSSTLP